MAQLWLIIGIAVGALVVLVAVRPALVDRRRREREVIDLGRSLAYAAALRVARFGNANEHADWETAHHVFTYANAVHQMLTRAKYPAARLWKAIAFFGSSRIA